MTIIAEIKSILTVIRIVTAAHIEIVKKFRNGGRLDDLFLFSYFLRNYVFFSSMKSKQKEERERKNVRASSCQIQIKTHVSSREKEKAKNHMH